jgi:predicted secreted Zn-dependent protease
MRYALVSLLSLVLLAACGIPSAPVAVPVMVESVSIPNATVVYYDVVGSTEADLRAQLDALGPRGYDGYKGDATTQWNISWHWPSNSDGSCRLTETVVSCEIKVIFPRWRPPSNVSPALAAKWARYIHALAEHEKGHVDFVVANIPIVESAIKGATCQTANAAGEAALAVIRKHDIDYDAATQHGVTQGARFP